MYDCVSVLSPRENTRKQMNLGSSPPAASSYSPDRAKRRLPPLVSLLWVHSVRVTLCTAFSVAHHWEQEELRPHGQTRAPKRTYLQKRHRVAHLHAVKAHDYYSPGIFFIKPKYLNRLVFTYKYRPHSSHDDDNRYMGSYRGLQAPLADN